MAAPTTFMVHGHPMRMELARVSLRRQLLTMEMSSDSTPREPRLSLSLLLLGPTVAVHMMKRGQHRRLYGIVQAVEYGGPPQALLDLSGMQHPQLGILWSIM